MFHSWGFPGKLLWGWTVGLHLGEKVHGSLWGVTILTRHKWLVIYLLPGSSRDGNCCYYQPIWLWESDTDMEVSYTIWLRKSHTCSVSSPLLPPCGQAKMNPTRCMPHFLHHMVERKWHPQDDMLQFFYRCWSVTLQFLQYYYWSATLLVVVIQLKPHLWWPWRWQSCNLLWVLFVWCLCCVDFS